MDATASKSVPGVTVLPTLVLLPGLDGTGALFERFIAATPAGVRVQVLALPHERWGYGELGAWVRARLPAEDVVLVGESFSGPLAIAVAAQSERVKALVLSTTFVAPPVPRAFARCPGFVWSRPPPLFMLKSMLTGGDVALAIAMRQALESLPSGIVAARAAAVFGVDVSSELRALHCPVLYLRARQDRLVRRGSAARVCALKPSTEMIELDAPHLLLQAQPAEAWTCVLRFLERTHAKSCAAATS